MTDSQVPTEAKPSFKNRPLTFKLWQFAGVLFVALILGAIMGGSTGSADAEKAEAELADVKNQLKLANEQSETIQAGAKSAEAEAQELLKKNEEKAKELAVREAQLGTKEAEKKLETELTTFSNGVHEVGTDIRAGKYKTDGSAGCYWAKLEANDDIIDNDLPGGPSTVTIEPTVAKFQSKNCGTWTKVG